jgi:hypothetical protein
MITQQYPEQTQSYAEIRPTRPGRFLLLGIALSFAPKCPACWPLYASALSIIGFDFLLEYAVVVMLLAVAMVAALYTFVLSARQSRDYRPFVLAVAASSCVFLGSQIYASLILHVTGMTGIMAAMYLNSRLKIKSKTCNCHATVARNCHVRAFAVIVRDPNTKDASPSHDHADPSVSTLALHTDADPGANIRLAEAFNEYTHDN